MTETLDITPSPRILSTLGDIPFEIWQCLAELSDNSLDSFRNQAQLGQPVINARIDIYWSKESTPATEREIIVEDNGPGMSIGQLQNAARAGFSSNDPIRNLGLFGMGFNISTARLGVETLFLSATKESPEWVGIKINFSELVESRSFIAPIVTRPKESPDESGTRVIVRQLKDGVFNDIQRKKSSIQKRLEVIYTPIIDKRNVEIYFRGKKLRSRPRCVWGESRYVIYKREKVYAVQKIDRDLGETWFDTENNSYLSDDDVAELNFKESKGKSLPEHIEKRSRRLKGWIGIQRYADTAEFGIDFIRNGRKILIGEKRLFSFENPDTGSFIPEYPIDLGSTSGGRIIGELHVDYLIPTYQKNDFDATDIAWRLTIEAIRGSGPILPKRRKTFGYEETNTSPLGLLINAYRRVDAGTKNLSLQSAVAKDFRKKFEKGDPDYMQDDKWYKAVQEADREKGAPQPSPDPGDVPTDNPDEYGFPSASNEDDSTSPPPIISSNRDDLIKQSERIEQLCGDYRYNEGPPFSVTARKTNGLQIKVSNKRLPSVVFQDGVEMDFFYDETHPLLMEYSITPRQLLLLALAEKFTVRDTGINVSEVFVGLVENHLADERINVEVLKGRAQTIFSNIQERLPSLLVSRIQHAIDIVKEVESEEESLAEMLLSENPELLKAYQKVSDQAHHALAYIPLETLIRLVDKMPEEFLDERVFTLPYHGVNVGTEKVNERLRRHSVDKVLNYLRDIRSLLKGGESITKHELIRYSNTLLILEDRLV